jgi:hypothetical protein
VSGKGRFLLLALVTAILCAQTSMPSAPQPAAPPPSHDTKKVIERSTQIASAVSTITSTAISPLLGVCVLGVYEYFKTPAADRHTLPMYTLPWFWIPIGCLLILIVLKDTVGGAVPLIKKPLDAIEVLMLNKASLILIAFPVVLHEVAKIMGIQTGQAAALLLQSIEPVVYAQGMNATAQQAGQATLAFLLVVQGIIIAFVVWLVGHAFDVLVLLSPFPFLDLLLKGIRTAIFAVLAVFTILDPRVAVVLSAFVILISALLFGWAFRLLVFGARFSIDLLRTLLFNSHREPDADEPLLGFTALKIGRVPKRTFGRLTRGVNGALEFTFRPWLLGAPRSVQLDPAAAYEVGRGLFYPTLIETRERSSSHKTRIRLLPRYRNSEEKIATILGLKGVKDVRLSRGLHSFWLWLKDDSADPSNATGATAGS